MSEALFWFDWGYNWLKLLVCVGLSVAAEGIVSKKLR